MMYSNVCDCIIHWLSGGKWSGQPIALEHTNSSVENAARGIKGNSNIRVIFDSVTHNVCAERTYGFHFSAAVGREEEEPSEVES